MNMCTRSLQYPNSEQQGFSKGQPKGYSTWVDRKGGAAQLPKPVPPPNNPRHVPTLVVQPPSTNLGLEIGRNKKAGDLIHLRKRIRFGIGLALVL